MGIAGNLQTMELAELLQWLSHGTKTGTLVIDGGEVKKRLFFRDGKIISTASTDPREHLGHFLVSHGFITEEELAKAVSMQEKSKMLLGKILTTIGAISEEDLHRLLRLKAEESVYDLFSWETGDFRFLDGELPEATMVPMKLDATSIILEGVQRIDEWKRIREVVPSAQAVPVAVADLLADPKLTPAERTVLDKVDDDRTVEEIQLQAHASEYLVSKVLFDQVRKKRLKVVRPRWAQPPEGRDAASTGTPGADAAAGPARGQRGTGAAGRPAAGGVAVSAPDLVAEAKRHLAAKEMEQALRHLRAARSLDPDSKEVQRALEQGEAEVAAELEKAGVKPEAVPKLKRTMKELTQLELSPQEGFIITRVNGSYDIRSIVKISPIPQLDALLVFYRLFQAGHIELK
ncbi:MAG TPA: DUF4388 domain-containing protein [Thermoanaerobaculia bacterium]|nr:DUF4388 domain-containing protein [Thermoanaerobaculia bacterium]